MPSNDPGPKVLFVDDEEAFLRGVSRAVSRHGYEVLTATSGEVFRFLEKPCSTDMLALTMELALQVRRLKLASWALLQKVREDKSSLAELERESKGITDVRRDSGGAILIEESDMDLEALTAAIHEELS